MKIKLYPKGYAPMIAAAATPSEDLLKMDITWTEEQHEYMKKLESEAVTAEVSTPSTDRWYEILSNEEVETVLAKFEVIYQKALDKEGACINDAGVSLKAHIAQLRKEGLVPADVLNSAIREFAIKQIHAGRIP